MRKGLTIFSLLFIILIVFGQFVLPSLAERTAQARIMAGDRATAADVTLHSQPSILLLLGQIDMVKAKADGLRIGQLRLQQVTMQGRNVRIDVSSFLMDDELSVRSADELSFTGVIREDNIQDLLQRRVDKLQNVQVKITRGSIKATAQAKIFGRMADIDLEGTVFENDGGLYFHMTRLNIRNAVLGKTSMGELFGDILLTKLTALPLKAQVDSVDMQDGQIVVTASCHNS